MTTFVLTYLAVLVVLFAVNAVVGIEASRAVERELERADIALFSQLRQSLDAALEPAASLIAQLSLDSRLTRLLYQREPLGAEHYYEVTQLVDELSSRATVAPHVEQLYVYLRASNRIVSSTSHADPELMYSAAFRYKELTYEAWLALLRTPRPRRFLHLTVTAEGGKERPAIACVQSLPLQSRSDAAATVVAAVDEDYIRSLTSELPWLEGGGVLILQDDGAILFSTAASSVTQELRYGKLLGEAGPYQRRRLGGKNAVVFSAQAVVPELMYVVVVPLRVFLGPLYYVRRLMLAATIVYVLVGAAFLFLYPRRHFRPLQELLRMLRPSDGALAPPRGNEYRFVTNTIRAILEEKTAALRKLEAQDAVLRDGLLVRLLRAETTWAEATRAPEGSPAFPLPAAPYVVLLFSFTEIPRFAGGELEPSWPSIQTSVVASVVQAAGGGKVRCHAVHMGDRVAVLASIPELDAPEREGFLRALVEETHRDLAEEHGLGCVVAAGAVHADARELAAAYQEAQSAEQHRLLDEHGYAFVYAPGGPLTEGRFDYPAEAEAALTDHVRLGNSAEAVALVDSVLDANLVSGFISFEKARCLISDLAGTLVKTLDSSGLSGDETRPSESAFLAELQACRTLAETRAVFHAFIERICASLGARRGASLSARVGQYVRSNTNDLNMNVNTIAYRFDLTPGYLSRVFRQETGTRLLDFICNVRLAEARRILTSSTATLSDVAARAGFSSSTALIRAFKKHQGITPGQLKRVSAPPPPQSAALPIP